MNKTLFSSFPLMLGLTLLGCSAVVPALAAASSQDQPNRPRIGLVLSGGGARGTAHIGVLKVLEELRIPVDALAATSMGAVVGGAYASGMPVEEMEKLVLNIDWNDLFTDTPPREILSSRRKQEERKYLINFPLGFRGGKFLLPKGAITGQKLDQFMRKLAGGATGASNFDQLPIPFRAIATDLVSGEMVVFEHGDLASAMRASMSVPGAIAPTEIGERVLVDGGLVRNLPVDIVRQMGVDVVIAVNLGTPLLAKEELASFVGVTVQMIGILTEQNVQMSIASLGDDDILILPELGDITAADFRRAAEAIEIGMEATRKSAERLRRYSLSEREYQAWHRNLERQPPPPQVIAEIRIEPLQRVNPDVIQGMLTTEPGQPLDPQALGEDIARIYGHGDFERVSYRVIEEQGRHILIIDAVEKSWGPNYLRFGLGFSSDFQGDTKFALLTRYNRTWVNSLGAEWSNDLQLGTTNSLRSEFYQPLRLEEPYFIAPYLEYKDRSEDIFRGSSRIAEYDVTTARLGFDVGLDLHQWGELRLGLLRGLLDTEPSTGALNLPEINTDEGAVTGSYWYDQFDRTTFPTHGSGARADLFIAREELGSKENYLKVGGKWEGAFSKGKHTATTGLELGATPDGELPIYDEFSLGGFLRLSGLRDGQLRGQYLGFGRLVYYQNPWQFAAPLRKGYAGGSVELGNVWKRSDDIGFDDIHGAASLFFGLDTVVGPLFLGYGITDNGDNSAYVFLGRP